MKVYVGIPMYGGADAQFVSSLLKTRVVLDRLGYEVEVDIHNGCSILTKARNEITQRFIDSQFDVLLFVDSDMAWSPVDAVKLLRAEKEFGACVYRSKTEKETYHCKTKDVGEWIKADGVGTGFIALSRECVLKMMEAHPETKYTEDGKDFHALFDFELFEGRYWGEDYTFCRRWRAIGGEIDVMTDATIKHIGNKTYEGNFSAYQKGN